MMHNPILVKDISLCFTNKIYFEDFSTSILPGSRIAIIGNNGSGKFSLLKMLSQLVEPSSGQIFIPDDISIGYVEQIISDFNNLSGGQRLNKKLTQALSNYPDILLLDEPTNHLDSSNRKVSSVY